MPIQILAVSDEVDARIHSPSVRERMGHVTFVVGCGDLPASYLEFLADALDRPVYYVLGNHLEELTRGGEKGRRFHPLGGIDLGGQIYQDEVSGLILAGLPGSPEYSGGPQQFSEFDLYRMIVRMAPRLLWNRWRRGRALDVLVTHSPARDIGDREDPAHRGFQAIRRFLEWFAPTYHLHGHVHLYDRSQSPVMHFGETTVINVFPFQVIDVEVTPVIMPARMPVASPEVTAHQPLRHAEGIRPELERGP